MSTPDIKDIPIIFSGPMVRAILEGRKTQTRRPLKFEGQNQWWLDDLRKAPLELKENRYFDNGHVCFPTRYGKPGDRMWVRETWEFNGPNALYCADFDGVSAALLSWKPSIHMPRRVSRITLEITRRWVEDLHYISNTDALAEGITIPPNYPHEPWQASKRMFEILWDSIYQPKGLGWATNPLVECVEFKILEIKTHG
jgi:hypothetical protein